MLPQMRAYSRRRNVVLAASATCVVALVVGVVGVTHMWLRQHGRTGRGQIEPVALQAPGALGVDIHGDLLIADDARQQILRQLPGGQLQVVAGTGTTGFAGDYGPATAAQINDPRGMAVAADGTIFFADSGNNRIREILPSGNIRTIAGDGKLDDPVDGQPANTQPLSSVFAVALAPGGQLYFTESSQVDSVSADGILHVVVSADAGRKSAAQFPASLSALAFSPTALAFDKAGDMYLANMSPKLLLRRTAAGVMTVIRPETYVSVAGLSSGLGGAVLAALYSFQLDTITGSQVTTMTDFAAEKFAGISLRPAGVAQTPDGSIYVSDPGNAGGASGPTLLVRSPNTKQWAHAHVAVATPNAAGSPSN